MKVLIAIKRDYANVGYTFSEMLNKVGVNTVALSVYGSRMQKLGGLRKAEKVNGEEMQKQAKEADIIIFMHSEIPIEATELKKLKNKRYFVFHGGSSYRDKSRAKNRIFNPLVEKCLIQTRELFDRGAKNEVWLLPPVNLDIIKPMYERFSDKLIIGHYPTSVIGKNSLIFNEVIDKLKEDKDLTDKFEYRFEEEVIAWTEHLKRVSECDIYLEQIEFIGEWSISALEAAALGCVVVTNFKSVELYRKEFGECAIQIANDKNQLEQVLRRLILTSDKEIQRLKYESRKWVEQFHSYDYVGNRLKKILGL